eukprot:6487741-Prymnesium_polylepis.2
MVLSAVCREGAVGGSSHDRLILDVQEYLVHCAELGQRSHDLGPRDGSPFPSVRTLPLGSPRHPTSSADSLKVDNARL